MDYIKMYEKEIVRACSLRVAAGTTGKRGGDTGHGGRTVIELEDTGSTDVEFAVSKDGKKLEIKLGGDAELENIIEAFEFVVDVMKREAAD